MSKCPNCKKDSLSFETEDNLPLENPYCFECDDFIYDYEEEDNINPDHYKDSKIECIDAIESSMTPGSFQGYLKGTIIAYLWRYEQKNGQEDLNKAQWYLTKLISKTK